MPSSDDDDALADLNDRARAGPDGRALPEAIEEANRLLLEHETERLISRLKAPKENSS